MASPTARFAVSHARQATSLPPALFSAPSLPSPRLLRILAQPIFPPSGRKLQLLHVPLGVIRCVPPAETLGLSDPNSAVLSTGLCRGTRDFLKGGRFPAKERAFSGWAGAGQRGTTARAARGGGGGQQTDRGSNRGKGSQRGEGAGRGGGGGGQDGGSRRGNASNGKGGRKGGGAGMGGRARVWGEVGERSGEWGEGKAQRGGSEREAIAGGDAEERRARGNGRETGSAGGAGEVEAVRVIGEERQSGDGRRREGGEGQRGNSRRNIIDEVAAAMEKPPARVILKRGRAALFASACPAPLVFSGAVDCVLGRPPPQAGDIVVLAARRGEQQGGAGAGEGSGEGEEAGKSGGEWSQGVAVAWGVFNPASMYRVRILQTLADAHRHPQAVLSIPSLLRLRLTSSLHLRLLLGLSPLPCSAFPGSSEGAESRTWRATSGTNVFRLVNSEGDRLSGLIVDAYGDHLVVASSAAWVEAHRPAVEHALESLLPASPLPHTQGLVEHEGVREGGVGGGEREEGNESGRIVWRRSVEMLREEGVVVEGGEGEQGRVSEGGRSDGEEAEGGGEVEEEGAVTVVAGNGSEEQNKSAESEVTREAEGAGLEASAREAVEAGAAGASETTVSEHRVKVVENGVLFWVALASGQKTGFYSDQRDSRLLVRSLVASSLLHGASSATHGSSVARDQKHAITAGLPSSSTSLQPLASYRPLSRVLDLCCYSGGFAINAALAGAVDVTAVDSSPSALALAADNLALNSLPPSAVHFERADISAFMQRAVAGQREWDLVVLDPPKLAPTRKSLPRALHRYRRLNALALRLVAPGGLLMTCSCSGAVSQQHLLPSILREAAASAGRQVTIIRDAGAAPCHPIDPACPEGTYLTNLLALVH